jgi:hypothetical protein
MGIHGCGGWKITTPTKGDRSRKSCGGWINFAQEIKAIVLFANGFQDVIEPVKDSTGLCRRWKQVPKDKDYLAAGVHILNTLYKGAGYQTTKEYLTNNDHQWHRGRMVFEKCPSNASVTCNCDRLQQIIRKKRKVSGGVTPLDLQKDQGAVIFGQPKNPLPPWTMQTRSMRKDNEENNPLAPHTKSPGLPGVIGPLSRERSPLKMIPPAPDLSLPSESDTEGTEDSSMNLQENEYHKAPLPLEESHEESKTADPWLQLFSRNLLYVDQDRDQHTIKF